MAGSAWDFLLGVFGQSAATIALLGAAGFLARNLITARLTRAVQHEFDEKLMRLKQEIETKARQAESLRETAFSASLAQRSAIAAKRIEAAEGLWNGVLTLGEELPSQSMSKCSTSMRL
jgi:hypothetical protein